MFEEIQGNGKVWIYGANRNLSDQEQEMINRSMDQFLSQWSAHGKALKAQFKIFYDQVLVLAVDNDFESASGCSIDSSVQVFREINEQLNLDLFNRLNLMFLENDKLITLPVAVLNDAYHQGEITSDSILLDNSISDLAKFKASWHTPLKQSWAFRKIKQTV